MVIFTFYTFFLPTKTKHDFSFTVMFETLILGNIIVMLSLKTTTYIQDFLEKPIDLITEGSCQNSQVLTRLVVVLIVLYYVPVLIILLCLTFKLIKWINCFKWIIPKRYGKVNFIFYVVQVHII